MGSSVLMFGAGPTGLVCSLQWSQIISLSDPSLCRSLPRCYV
jgi:hypothetical protein